MLTLVPTLQGQENYSQCHNCLMTCRSNFSPDPIFFDLSDTPYDFNKEDGKMTFQRQVLWSVYLKTITSPSMKAVIAEPHRKGTQDARAMYKAVVYEFNRPTVLGALEICEKLFTLKMEDCPPYTVNSFHAEIQHMNDLLKTQGIKIPDTVLMWRFIKGLPSIFQTFVNTLSVLKCGSLEEVYKAAREHAAQNKLERLQGGDDNKQVFLMQPEQQKI